MDEEKRHKALAGALGLTLPFLAACGLMWWGGESREPAMALTGLLLLAGWSVFMRRHAAGRAARDPEFAGQLEQMRRRNRRNGRGEKLQLKILGRSVLIFLALVFGSAAVARHDPGFARLYDGGVVTVYLVMSIALGAVWQWLNGGARPAR